MTSGVTSGKARAQAFCERFGLRVPILMAPMASASPAGLAVAVANAGGMGALGALMTKPSGIAGWVAEFRGQSNGAFQLNLWIRDPPPVRDTVGEARVRAFLGEWGPAVPPEDGDAAPLDFVAQCQALLDARPPVVSSIMGVFPPRFRGGVEGAGDRLVRLRDDAGGGAAGGGGGRRCHCRARDRGWRPSGCVRRRGGGAAGRRAARAAATVRRQSVGADHRYRRDWRRAWGGRGADTWGERRADWHLAAAVSGGGGLRRPGLPRWRDWSRRARCRRAPGRGG